jgi:hypothetical protein
LKFAASAVNSGNPLASASMIHGILRRTLHDWVSQEGSFLKKLGRNAVLPADTEKQLHRTIVRLKDGFGLTPNHNRRFAVLICKEHSMQNPCG